ncbi:hypothetical protein OV208_18310 [Corallococcus sp. bb12-1]|uniref:hypothetical protein n=1 Tax=Corallococcus sp. bb12-1 TaxID=2996784 RepID=UPI00226F103F|nr:hypothetical protein [Corallococcus sp. bb12-1]MCY1043276.1 hypothetical protein [Corallococcus sp. bb12-1]
MNRASPSPVLEVPPPPATSGSRGRFWAARLVLFVACASVVATSQATSPDVDSKELVGAPLSLTTEAPKASRRLLIRASAPKPPSKRAEGEVSVRVTARWIPADPSQTVSPWLKVMLSEDADSSGAVSSGILTAGTPLTLEGSGYLSPDCELKDSCEWSRHVNFEFQANAAAGTVELEWTAQAHVRVVDTSSVPDGFTVDISAP